MKHMVGAQSSYTSVASTKTYFILPIPITTQRNVLFFGETQLLI